MKQLEFDFSRDAFPKIGNADEAKEQQVKAAMSALGRGCTWKEACGQFGVVAASKARERIKPGD